MAALTLGAVAYDPKVVTIWEGFRTWLRREGLKFDFVLYSHYERQVDDLMAERIDVAWNSPLAWVRARRLAAARLVEVRPVAMRDTDRDLTSVVVSRTGSGVKDLDGLQGRTIGVGSIDSPQATLLPLSLLLAAGLIVGSDITVRRFDVGVGLHGDHIGGERAAAAAMAAGKIDAACMTDSNLLLFSKEGTLPAGTAVVLGHTPTYDHCNMTVGPAADDRAVSHFVDLLLAMSYADEQVRPLLDLEGLTRWLPGRVDGYAPLEVAVDEAGFYDSEGRPVADGYRP